MLKYKKGRLSHVTSSLSWKVLIETSEGCSEYSEKMDNSQNIVQPRLDKEMKKYIQTYIKHTEGGAAFMSDL